MEACIRWRATMMRKDSDTGLSREACIQQRLCKICRRPQAFPYTHSTAGLPM